MGFSVFPAPASGITVSDGNNAGWRRTNPGGLTLVASGDWNTSVNTITISTLSGYSFYRLFVAGYYNAVPLYLRFNSNAEGRYEWSGYLSTSGAPRGYGESGIRINYSNANEYNSCVVDIHDADSANYKFVEYSQITRGTANHSWKGSWLKAEALSSLTLYTNNGENFASNSFTGQGYYLYGGY